MLPFYVTKLERGISFPYRQGGWCDERTDGVRFWWQQDCVILQLGEAYRTGDLSILSDLLQSRSNLFFFTLFDVLAAKIWKREKIKEGRYILLAFRMKERLGCYLTVQLGSEIAARPLELWGRMRERKTEREEEELSQALRPPCRWRHAALWDWREQRGYIFDELSRTVSLLFPCHYKIG